MVSGDIGEANHPLEFFLTSGPMREPAGDENYLTGIDTIFIQGGEIFSYSPKASLSAARRDYDPAEPPLVFSQILGENRPYRVLLPRGYDEQEERYYPVLYCLEGHRIFEESFALFGERNPQEALDPDGETPGRSDQRWKGPGSHCGGN